MDKKYNPKNIEEKLYQSWEEKGYFQPHNNTSYDNYCIMMPPPNITGNLHLGHAFQQTIMDILVRYHRMQGKNTLWQPGTDHAGIATQILIERNIYEQEKKTRNQYGKKQFIQKIWEWQKKYKHIITYQMKRLGISADWQHELFTMDNKISYAVQEVFIQLYKENLIYRKQCLVNWDPKMQTAISDLEIDIKKTQKTMWYIKYQLSNQEKTNQNLHYLTIATSRPETMFGDVAVSIHPDDHRYNNLIGKHVYSPITHRKIPIISDNYVDITKGTGCMKITPAHDFNDYEIAKRHKLPIINIFTPNGNIREIPEIFNNHVNNINIQDIKNYIPKIFHNLNRFIARNIIISECNKRHLLIKQQTYDTTASYSSRSGELIEPMLTNQWYLRTNCLSKQAIQAVKDDMIQFIPKQYKKIYFKWMHNIQDWCISRQIWWGHNIPVWYDNNNNTYVGHNETEIRQNNKLNKNFVLYQDTDVLDTWFSSALWTFASLGWPKQTKELQIFHPTNVIVSGFDIIFFWIARMIMLTMHFVKDQNNNPQIPFKTVYITGLILDETGQKMSKSKGNIIDPLDIIEGISANNLLHKRTSYMLQPKLINKITINTKKKFPNGIQAHGADTLRFTLTSLASTGKHIHWDMKQLSGYHNFCNKLWNAGHFVIMNIKEQKYNISNKQQITFSTAEKWILTELQKTIKNFRYALDSYRFDQAAYILYNFIWHKFCDWYIEIAKIAIQKQDTNKLYGTYYTLINTLEVLLRLAHPIIPFITETIWQEIKKILKYEQSIMIQPFPSFNESMIYEDSVTDMKWIQQVITKIRSTKNLMHIPNNLSLNIIIQQPSNQIKHRIQDNFHILSKMANINDIQFSTNNKKHPKSITILFENTKIFMPIKNLFDKTIEINRLSKELKKIDKDIIHITNKINNKNFMNKAPHLLITKEQNKLKNLQILQTKLIEEKRLLLNLL